MLRDALSRLAKVGAKDQLLIVAVRALHFEIVVQAAAAEFIGAAANGDPGLERRDGSVSVRDDDERAILKHAQQWAIGGEAQRPGPVILRLIGLARLRREPAEGFIQRIQREVDDQLGIGDDAKILAQGREEERSGALTL